MIGIYRIINKANGKCYVGQSKDIDSRFKNHKRRLKGGYHFNKKLQQDWYDIDSDFDFEILEILEQCSNLDSREIYWINHFNSCDQGYNLTYGADRVGRKCPKEVKEKMSKKRLDNNKFRGSNLKQSKLTEKEVAEIKVLLVDGVRNVEIADMFGVSQQVISMIKKCICWKYVRADLNL